MNKGTPLLPGAAKNFTAKTERDVIVKVNRHENNLLNLRNSKKMIHQKSECRILIYYFGHSFLLCTLFGTFLCRFSNICKQN